MILLHENKVLNRIINELKTILARLAPKQQALIFGHAVPMPVAFRPKDWGTAKSYEELNSGGESTAKQAAKDIKELFE